MPGISAQKPHTTANSHHTCQALKLHKLVHKNQKKAIFLIGNASTVHQFFSVSSDQWYKSYGSLSNIHDNMQHVQLISFRCIHRKFEFHAQAHGQWGGFKTFYITGPLLETQLLPHLTLYWIESQERLSLKLK